LVLGYEPLIYHVSDARGGWVAIDKSEIVDVSAQEFEIATHG